MTRKSTIIVDGNSAYSRGYYASSSSGSILDPRGNPVGAVSAALSMVLSWMDTHGKLGNVGAALFCWDTGQKKDKGRGPKPPDYHGQLDLFIELLTSLFGVAHAIPPSHEADDSVATAVYRLTETEHPPITVVSGDKDLQSLQSDGQQVSYYCLNEKATLSSSAICRRWNVKHPVQVSIALAVLGDSSDRVGGIKGWGPVKVKQLFEHITPEMRYGDVLEAIDAQIPDAKKDQFYESLDLTILDPNVPNVPDPAPLVWNPAGSEILDRDYGLPKLAQFYRRIYGQYNEDASSDEVDAQLGLNYEF